MILISLQLHAQFNADWRIFDSIPVIDHSGDTLSDPWVGGLNNPQFSTIDLDGDGKEDLFVFERDGNQVKTFINIGTTGQSAYKYDPQYEDDFPQLFSFALLRDFNGDGKKDIFTYTHPGIGVYKNVSSGGQLQWEQLCYFKDFYGVDQCYLTMYFGPNKTRTQIYTIPDDIPAFDDIDGDGDLDILSFGVQGNTVTFYKNISTNPDTLDYALCTQCWGNFYESAISNDGVLDYYCGDSGTCAEIPIPREQIDPVKKRNPRHAGSTLLTFDRDADGDKEILLGDISFPNMVLCQNGGSSSRAKITSYSNAYPTSTTPVDLFIFPAGFYEDIDNDNVKDLIVAPNAVLESENHRNVWLYDNTRATNRPNFVYREREFLVGDMVDLGSGTAPLLIDVNGDSLLDLLVGNSGYYKRARTYPSGLAYFENTGLYTDSTVYPIFSLRDTNFLSIFDDSLGAVSPTAADIDADGDLDLILGDRNGKIHLYQNNAQNPGDSAIFVKTPGWDTAVDVGSWATPFFFDLDDDGDLDLISGERYGSLYFYLNQGDSANPSFDNNFRMPNWGGVVHQDALGDGFSQPFIVKLDTNGNIASDSIPGQTYLFVGNTDGNIYIYSGIDGNLFGNFNLSDTLLLGLSKSTITGADLSRDGKLDLVLGQQTGGLAVLLKGRGFELPKPPPSYDLTMIIETDSGWILPFANVELEGVQKTADSLGRVYYQGLSPGMFHWNADGSLFGVNYIGADSLQVNSDTTLSVQLSAILSLNELDDKDEIKVFPNPAKSRVVITSSKSELTGIELYDMSGRIVISRMTAANRIELSIEELGSGIYQLLIHSGSSDHHRRLVITE